MTKIKIKTNLGLVKTNISVQREGGEKKKTWEGKKERKQEKPRQTKRKKQEKNKSKAILRYFLAYLDLSSYFEDMTMNL